MRKRADQDRGPGGYIYVSDEPRHGDLVADGASFTAVVPRQRRPPTTQAAFLTLSGETVDVVARIRQAGPAASFKARLRFDELQPMLCSLMWTEVVEKLSSAARAEVEQTLGHGGGPIGETAFAELATTLQRLCPESGGDIDLVLMLSRERANLPVP